MHSRSCAGVSVAAAPVVSSRLDDHSSTVEVGGIRALVQIHTHGRFHQQANSYFTEYMHVLQTFTATSPDQSERQHTQLVERAESVHKLPKFWDTYDSKIDGGVPSLTEHFVHRGTSAEENFVSGVVDRLLTGRAACSCCRLYVDRCYITHDCKQIYTSNLLIRIFSLY